MFHDVRLLYEGCQVVVFSKVKVLCRDRTRAKYPHNLQNPTGIPVTLFVHEISSNFIATTPLFYFTRSQPILLFMTWVYGFFGKSNILHRKMLHKKERQNWVPYQEFLLKSSPKTGIPVGAQEFLSVVSFN